MSFALLIIFSLLSVGLALANIFFGHLPWWVRVLLSILLGWVVGAWLIFILVMAFGYEQALVAFVLMGSLIGLRHLWSVKFKQLYLKLPETNLDYLALLVALGWFGWMAWLYWTHNFLVTEAGYFTGGSAYGDLALHATQINFFAVQPELDLTSPIYALHNNTYPFMLNFLAGMMVRTGFDLSTALNLTSLSLFPVLLGMIWLVLKRLGGTSRSFIFASSFLLLNGGVGGYYFWQDFTQSGRSFWQFLLNQPVQYAHYAGQNLFWSNFVADTLLPQRSLVVGMMVVLLLLACYADIFKLLGQRGSGVMPAKKTALRSIWGASVLLGLIPLFHIHSFLVGSVLLVWFLVVLKYWRLLNWRETLSAILIVVFLASPQLWWQFSQTFSTSFVRLGAGWMAGDQGVVWFWLRNLGPSSLLAVSALIFALKRRLAQPFIWVMLLPLLGLFVINNLIIFQPHSYDNLKFMILSYLGVCLIAGLWLDEFWVGSGWRQVVIIILVPLITFTGLVSLIRETTLSYQLAGPATIELAEQVTSQTDSRKIFLTADWHNHPVSMLAGRKILMGYRGWLWTHGVDYSQVELDIRDIYWGQANAMELLDQYQIGYIFVGVPEIRDLQADQDFFADNFELVIDHPMGRVYRR